MHILLLTYYSVLVYTAQPSCARRRWHNRNNSSRPIDVAVVDGSHSSLVDNVSVSAADNETSLADSENNSCLVDSRLISPANTSTAAAVPSNSASVR